MLNRKFHQSNFLKTQWVGKSTRDIFYLHLDQFQLYLTWVTRLFILQILILRFSIFHFSFNTTLSNTFEVVLIIHFVNCTLFHHELYFPSKWLWTAVRSVQYKAVSWLSVCISYLKDNNGWWWWWCWLYRWGGDDESSIGCHQSLKDYLSGHHEGAEMLMEGSFSVLLGGSGVREAREAGGGGRPRL